MQWSIVQPPIKLSDLAFGYPGAASPLFEHVELCVDCGSRLVLLGENGRGKTTLVKLMLGELHPTQGIVQREQGSRIALLNQHHADQLDLDQSPLDFLADQVCLLTAAMHMAMSKTHPLVPMVFQRRQICLRELDCHVCLLVHSTGSNTVEHLCPGSFTRVCEHT